MKKLICLSLALMLLALSLTACMKRYADDLPVKELGEQIATRLRGDVADYSIADDGYLDDYFRLPDYVTDHMICFSTAGNNLDEFGIFHVTNGNAEDLEDKLEEYLESAYEKNKDYYDSYMPQETPKLRDAEVDTFGNYVVYTILSKKDEKAALDAVEKALKK